MNKGYHLVTDNFYTKPAITEHLLTRKTLLTGTVRANSQGLPEGRRTKQGVGEANFWRKGELLFSSFREKKSQSKPVPLLTTGFNAVMEERVIRGKEKRKPAAIFHYNLMMESVDISDKEICHLASERSTRRYWVRIFQNLVDISIANFWILYQIIHNPVGKKPMSRGKYIISIVEALCNMFHVRPQRPPHFQPLQLFPGTDTHRIHFLDRKKEKDCFVCSDKAKDKKSSKGRKRTR